MNIWQVAAGDGERDYSHVFLKYGVMLIGGGWMGDFFDSKNNKDYDDPENRTSSQTICRFAKADTGDYVVLKRAKGRKWEVLAIGKIKSKYSFEPVFSDVEGFDLRHCRHVKWKEPRPGTTIDGLKQGRFSGVQIKKARNAVKRLWEKVKRTKSAKKIPLEPKKVSRKALIGSLMAEGLPKQRAKRIACKIWHLQKLAEQYESNYGKEDVSEHETRTFLIIPLIMSLGWDKKKVKIEWKHTDVALFDIPYLKESKPRVIIETKRLWHGLDGAREQANKYAKNFPKCKKLVVTDGIRYWLYTKSKTGRKLSIAYLNLLAPAQKHPYEPGVKGLVSFLMKLDPNC